MIALLAASASPDIASRPDHPTIPTLAEGNSVDFTACARCHGDKSQGEHLHPAVELGCDACHVVDQDADYTEVYLNLEGNELCLTCHTDKQPQPDQLDIHSPVRRQTCVTCHDPHVGAAASLLKAPTDTRDAEKNLCLTCHSEIAAQIAKPVLHGAVDMGCGTCHTTHKSEPVSQPEGMFHLTRPLPALCLDCHDAEDAALKQAHQNQPFSEANCAGCHNPHGSDRPKLINNFAHMPFVEKMCDACHAEPQNGKIALVEGARKDVCLACHPTVGEQVDQATVKHGALDVDSGCVGCHSPHATAYQRQLRQGPVRTCLTCHAERAEERAAKQVLHKPAFSESCVICHQPHGGDRERMLRAEVNTLCLECHNRDFPQTLQVLLRNEAPLRFLDGAVLVPSKALENIPTIRLAKGAKNGHPTIPIISHPVSGKYPLGDNMNCASCHSPHAASRNKLFVEVKGEGPVCQKCH